MAFLGFPLVSQASEVEGQEEVKAPQHVGKDGRTHTRTISTHQEASQLIQARRKRSGVFPPPPAHKRGTGGNGEEEEEDAGRWWEKPRRVSCESAPPGNTDALGRHWTPADAIGRQRTPADAPGAKTNQTVLKVLFHFCCDYYHDDDDDYHFTCYHLYLNFDNQS